MGVRVHTLAKELNRSSKELMDILRSQGIEVKNHFASVDEAMAAKLRIQFGGEDSIRKPEKGKQSAPTIRPEPLETPAPAAPAAPRIVSAPAASTAPSAPSRPAIAPVARPAPTMVRPVAAAPPAAAARAAETPAAEMIRPAAEAAPRAAESGARIAEPVVGAAPPAASAAAIPPPPSVPAVTAAASAPAAARSPDVKRADDRKIEMAPGFGAAATRPKLPVQPVARPMPSGGAPEAGTRKPRPLIIRAKPAAAPPPRRPGLPGAAGAPPRGIGPPRSPAGIGRAPGAPARGFGGPPGGGPGGRPGVGGRGPAPGFGGGFGGSRGSSGPPRGGPGADRGGPGSRVRFFPGEGGMPPGGAPAGRGARRGGGRRSGKTTRGGAGGQGGRSSRQRESLDFFTKRRQEEVLSGERPSELKVQLPITLKDLSPLLGVKQNFLLKSLMDSAVPVHVNTSLTEEMLLLIGDKFSVDIEVIEPQALDSTLAELETQADSNETLVPRAPVVTILGHVDHGKTSLLDKIRETHVTQSESGGITQHISAYRVDHENKHVVFIDTPGHKAFTEMRARGAKVTDVAVLVVAADDGPMPQTEEAMQHAQAADVPIVVAINKIDKPNANVARTKQMLAELGLSPPEWGGTTEMIEVSALRGTGIDKLLEHLSLETEILDLKANPDKNAIGTVLDARATTGRGMVVTVLVQEGTLHPGDVVICGPAYGKVRTLTSTTGVPIDAAGPSTPVEVTGLTDLPSAGDRFYGLDDLAKAREIAEDRQRKKRAADRLERSHVTLEKLFDHISQGKTKEIRIVLKTDVQGSLEVLKKELIDLKTAEVGMRILRGGVGEITEDDVLLADASDAIVIGFHVGANQRARVQADEKGVDIRTYEVIYQAIEEMRLALEGLLAPEISEEAQGAAEVLQVFKSSKLGNIAGCMVREGVIRREDPVRLVREGKMIFEGRLESLRRVKDDVREVKEGFECGMRVQGFDDLQIGDRIESYRKVERARTLGETSASS